MKPIFFLLISFIIVQSAFANDVALLDHKNIPHGQSPQGTYYSSCWGWVSPEGVEYAILGTYTGTSIYSTENNVLEEIQFVPGPTAGYAYREFKTYKNYLYIVSEGGSGVQIVDLSQLPDTAILIKNFNFTQGNKDILRSHTVTLADGYLYLNGSAHWSPGGMVIFSLLIDPTTPQYVGQYQPEYIHDSFVRNDTIYAAAIYSNGGLYIANAANKANPSLIKKITYSGSGTHHAWATIDGKYALTTDEIGTVNNMKVWDINNLGSGPPYTPAAQFRANSVDLTHNVHGRGHYAFLSHYAAGARVVDMHTPTSPVEVGFYDTDPNSTSGYEGCWAVYPYFFSGRWVASDMQSGLYLMSFSGMEPRIRPTLLQPSSGDSLGTSAIRFDWTRSTDPDHDPHWYELHIQGPGVSMNWNVNDTTTTLSDFTGFQYGEQYIWSVNVVDEFTSVRCQDYSTFIYNGATVGVKEPTPIPEEVSLSQNYPNPFNPSTSIKFSLKKESDISLRVFNLMGDELSSLIEGKQPQGAYEMHWDASQYPSGIYYYRLRVGNSVETKKMVLMR